MQKIEGLIFDSVSNILDDLFESTRLKLSLSEKQFRELLQSEKGKEIFKAFDETLTGFFLKRFTLTNFNKVSKISKANSNKIIKHNKKLFQYYFAFVETTHIVYKNLLKKIEKRNKGKKLEVRDLVNITFYGNLCRMSDEIGVLLTNGYPDGALILWRSFYEYCVVFVFLMKHYSNDLAQRFVDASQKDLRRQVESHNKRHIDLKFPALDKQLVEKVEKDFAEIKQKYPKEFFENDYSWAQDFVNGKPNFMNIEAHTDFGRYRPFYIWASCKSHPNYKELTSFRNSKKAFALSYVTIQDIDKTSMVDPAQLTLSTFYQVNSYFLHLYSVEYEYDTNMMMLRKIYDKFADTL